MRSKNNVSRKNKISYNLKLGICTGDEDTDVTNQCNVTVARKFSSLKR